MSKWSKAPADGRRRVKYRDRRNPWQPPQQNVRIVIDIPRLFAPAFRSAVEELSETLATRLERSHTLAREQSLTDATVCVGKLRAAVNAVVSKPDPNYGNRQEFE